MNNEKKAGKINNQKTKDYGRVREGNIYISERDHNLKNTRMKNTQKHFGEHSEDSKNTEEYWRTLRKTLRNYEEHSEDENTEEHSEDNNTGTF